MKISWIIKLNFLILALVVVIFASNKIGNHGLPVAVTDMFGLPPNQNQSLNWCETRVESLVRPDGYKIEQVDNKWFREDKDRREVSVLAVEKWLGRYCSVGSQLIAPSTASFSSFKPVLFVKFINDKVIALGRRADGTFLWNGRAFKSPELETGLNELSRIESQAAQD